MLTGGQCETSSDPHAGRGPGGVITSTYKQFFLWINAITPHKNETIWSFRQEKVYDFDTKIYNNWPLDILNIS